MSPFWQSEEKYEAVDKKDIGEHFNRHLKPVAEAGMVPLLGKTVVIYCFVIVQLVFIF